MQTADHGIQNQYLIAKNYVMVADWSKRRNILYDNYLQILQRIFTVYREFYDETQEIVRTKSHEKSVYLQEFKNFFRKFSEIIRDTSIYQVDCITDDRANIQDTVTKCTSEMTDKVQVYSKPQKNFKSKLDQLIDIRQDIEKQYSNLKAEISSAATFYNYRSMKARLKTLTDQLDQLVQLEKQLGTSREQINSNAEQFQGFLINFRKKLLQNKYNMLHKMIDQSKQFRNCLTQILLLLVQCVNSKSQQFHSLIKNPKDDTITLTQSKGRRKGQDIDTIISNLINSIQEYNSMIDEVIVVLKGFDTAFKKLNVKVQDILEINKKTFMDNLNNIYSIDETPSREVTETLDLFQFYTNKFATISDYLYQCSNRLNMLKQNVKRHADVTLSLIRTSFQKGSRQSPQVEQVYNQISYDFVIEVMNEVYKAFKDILSDLKTHFHQKYHKKKKMKTEDSMEISHIDQTIIVQKKRPCKKQLWLWRDWRDKSNFTNYFSVHNGVKDIKNFIFAMKMQEQSKQLQKFQCIFHGKKDIKGVLKVCQKTLQFISLIGISNVQLIIPYTHIEQIQLKVRMFQKCIVIKTQKGELSFSKFDNLQQSYNKVHEHMQKVKQSGGEKVIKKQAVQLSSQQIDYIQNNKARLEKQRPSTEGMIKIKGIFVDNVTIDQVYEFIYSDKPFTLRGKPEDSFFAYAMKKNKNFNYVAGQYDKPGPDFYSRNPQVKFGNSPVFSTKVNQFDHPMPPIPFMPKFCHCKEITKIYWLSNEYFDYSILSHSSGAPYADTFEVRIIHKVFKQGTGVRIQMMGGLYFVKETGMKGMLKSKGQNQMVQGGTFTANQIQKVLNMVSGNKVVQQQVKEETITGGMEKTPNSQVSKLKNQNKFLIIALVVVFLINILIKLFG